MALPESCFRVELLVAMELKSTGENTNERSHSLHKKSFNPLRAFRNILVLSKIQLDATWVGVPGHWLSRRSGRGHPVQVEKVGLEAQQVGANRKG